MSEAESNRQRFLDALEKLRRGEHDSFAGDEIGRLKFVYGDNGRAKLPNFITVPQGKIRPELAAAYFALAEAAIDTAAKCQQELDRDRREQELQSEAFKTLDNDRANKQRRLDAEKRYRLVVRQISQAVTPVKFGESTQLDSVRGVGGVLETSNLELCYADRECNAAILSITSSTHYKIIEFEMEVGLNGLTADQLDRLACADRNASWAGYHANLVRYEKMPEMLRQIYTNEFLSAPAPDPGANIDLVTLSRQKPGSFMALLRTSPYLVSQAFNLGFPENGRQA